MNVTQEAGARPIKAWTNDIEAAAMEQLRNCARMPFILGNGIAAMPDVHMGIGATVGSVIPTERAIIPAAVGVDIGCGMNAVRTSLTASDLPDSLAVLRHDIERSVPLGAGAGHREDKWGAGVDQQLMPSMSACGIDKLEKVSTKNAGRQLGTLGSGNHFIEVCLDESQSVWVMLHSGSRGIGNQIGRHFIERAKRRMEEFYITLPDADLAYFPEDTADFREYMAAVQWAQDYALENRRQMMAAVLRSLMYRVKPFELTTEAVNCFPGSVNVSGVDIKNVTKRHYKGDLLTIKLKSGRQLPVTPNHPLLARVGWTPANRLNIGDCLIGTVVADTLGTGVDPYVERVPSQFSELFNTLDGVGHSDWVVGAPVNFHGDVSVDNREVNIVTANGQLRYGHDTSLLEKFREFGLLSANLAESNLFSKSLQQVFSFGDWRVPAGDVGAMGMNLSFSNSQATHAVSLSGAPISGFNPSVSQKLANTRGADGGSSGQHFNGITDTVAFDEIVDIVRGHFTGHVYNLSCNSGWYIANGILAHNCHHNYVERENHFGRNVWVTRKGAIRAREGDMGIIPGSMGTRSYIVRGKGNPDSYCSCSHGAGRRMSRTQARKSFTVADLVSQTEGVECRKDSAVLDELPSAYKDIDVVMENQSDLVEIVHTLRAVLCVKGA